MPIETVTLTGICSTLTCRRLDRAADALGHRPRLLHARERQQAAEFLAAEPEQEIGRPDIVVHNGDEAREHVVAPGMAVEVVERLEMIEVEEDETERIAPLLVPQHDPGRRGS